VSFTWRYWRRAISKILSAGRKEHIFCLVARLAVFGKCVACPKVLMKTEVVGECVEGEFSHRL
jgi:hypothetical protein